MRLRLRNGAVGYPPFGYDSVREKYAAGEEIGKREHLRVVDDETMKPGHCATPDKSVAPGAERVSIRSRG
ncbi:MAG: hypothetical protein IH604_00265 [Burkholderiales bacterium]|nr:hypothetical protein [Burkholderiales bacterium]